MERLTCIIADKISLELKLDSDRKEIIAYGIFAILNMTFSIALVIMFGWIFGVLIESLIVSFSGSILRKYSGGVHASSPGNCTAAGTIIVIGQALLISCIMTTFKNLSLVIFLGLTTFAWSYYKIIKLAPVDSPSKPIKTPKKRHRMKKGSILVLTAYVAIVIINIIMFILTHKVKFLVFSLCIYGGTTWQTFTLTNRGHLTFKKIDAFLNQISNFIGRRE
jgi:accessory gene regulator B